MTDKPSIFEAMAAVMVDVGHVAKRDKNTHQNFMFRGIDAVVNAVGPELRKHGVIVVPKVLSVAYETVQTTTGKDSTACRVQVAYTFYGPAGDHIEASVPGEAWDSGDKATPKAMSVAFRTALLQALSLPTDEPDADSHTYERATSSRAQQSPDDGWQPPPAPVSDPLTNVSRDRVKAAWVAAHGSYEPAEMLADLASHLGLDDPAQATHSQLNTYADILEGKP